MSGPRSGRVVLAVMVLLGLLALIRTGLMGPMWLDEAYVAFGYADQISRGAGPFLPGQTASFEGITNPIWVAFFGLIGGLNIREADVQMPLATLAYVSLLYGVFRTVLQQTSIRIAVVSVALLGMAPVVASVRDGTDAICLAALSLWAILALANDEKLEGRTSMYLLFVLSLSGTFGWLVAMGLAAKGALQGRWRNLKIVFASGALLTVIRWFLDASTVPVFPRFDPSLSGFERFPVWSALVLLGVVVSHRSDRMVYGGVVLLGWGLACMHGEDPMGFGVSMIPVVGAMAVLAADALHWLRGYGRIGVVVLLLVGIDARGSEAMVEEIRTARLSHYFQSKGMGRFLLWRFGPTDSILVHRPGVVGYYSRRPLIDLSGRIHDAVPTPSEALQLNPVAVLPDRSIVSQKAQRLVMGPDWPTQLEERYKQYAIQHQKGWQMVDVDPVWFHLYIRKDLPMLRPEIPKSNGNIMPAENPFGDP